MKKSFIFTILLLTLIIIPFLSAEMIISQQPSSVYNLGDSVTIPITIKTLTGVSATFSMDLLCGSKQINFYKNGANLLAGEEKTFEASLVLTRELVGETTGTCKIKAILSGEDPLLTNEFKISNLITITPTTEETEFNPGQNILIHGDATKENGQPANGFIDLQILLDNTSEGITQRGTINNGMYSLNITLPENLKAGKYLVKLNAYEMTPDGIKTNKGFVNYNIAIRQIPTSLELVFKDAKVEPGTNVSVKAILHDQTGDKIDSTAIITIKRGVPGTLLENGGPLEKPTDEYMELPIAYDEPPANWTVFAMSNQLTAEAHFIITENKEIKADMINGTLILTNMGNVPYNDNLFIRIGNTTQPFNLSLGVDESKNILLDAAEGEHNVEILDSSGESKLQSTITIEKSRLTGNAVQIREASELGVGELLTRPLVWIIIGVIILGGLFVFLRERRKRNPSYAKGNGIFKKKLKHPKVNSAWENRAIPLAKESKLKILNRAKLALSIKGNKQDVSIVNITIKNLAEVQDKKGNPEEPLQKIVNLAENKKAFIYENQNTVAIILAPSKTRTFRNEESALEIAQSAKEVLAAHNRITKHRLDFGIAIEDGSIVERTENNVMEFMSLGILMANSKKIASASHGEVLLGERIKEKLTNVRTEKEDNGRIVFYKIKDIKYYDEGHSRYIKNFLSKAGENQKSKNQQQVNNKDSKKENASSEAKDPKSLIRGFY